MWGLDRAAVPLAPARHAAAASGRTVRWLQANVPALPFADASFDRVLTSSGVTFVPDLLGTARELARVCRPGGVVGLCHWTAEGVAGLVLRTMASRLLGKAEGGQMRALECGSEDFVIDLFAGLGEDVNVELERVEVLVEFESSHDYVRLLADHVRPLVDIKRPLSPRACWEDFAAEMTSLLEPVNETPGAGWTAYQECLVAVVHKQPARRPRLVSVRVGRATRRSFRFLVGPCRRAHRPLVQVSCWRDRCTSGARARPR